ncbi:hypothetical protein KQI84_14695 [bacterium]|nr:hypothetical protein [bacterium]
MFGQILKQWFWDCYDYLGRLLGMNLLLFVILWPVAFYLGIFMATAAAGAGSAGWMLVLCCGLAILIPVAGTIWFGGLLHFGMLSSDEKDPPFRSFFAGIRKTGFRLFRFLLVIGAAIALLVLNIWFYFYADILSPELWLLTYLLGGLCFWLILFVMGIALHGMPLVVRYERKTWPALKAGLYLSMKYPILTLGCVLYIGSLFVLAVGLRLVGLIVFAFSATGMFINSTHDVILEVEERAERAAAEEGDDRPTSWREIQEAEDENEEERLRKARYERTLRDILKPWSQD